MITTELRRLIARQDAAQSDSVLREETIRYCVSHYVISRFVARYWVTALVRVQYGLPLRPWHRAALVEYQLVNPQ